MAITGTNDHVVCPLSGWPTPNPDARAWPIRFIDNWDEMTNPALGEPHRAHNPPAREEFMGQPWQVTRHNNVGLPLTRPQSRTYIFRTRRHSQPPPATPSLNHFAENEIYRLGQMATAVLGADFARDRERAHQQALEEIRAELQQAPRNRPFLRMPPPIVVPVD